MGWDTPDVYYQPEKFGLTVVVAEELSEPSYSFDLYVVWKDATGVYYWGADSGCSCPSPFEDYTDLASLSSGSKVDALAAIEADITIPEWWNDAEDYWNDAKKFRVNAKAKLLEAVLAS